MTEKCPGGPLNKSKELIFAGDTAGFALSQTWDSRPGRTLQNHNWHSGKLPLHKQLLIPTQIPPRTSQYWLTFRGGWGDFRWWLLPDLPSPWHMCIPPPTPYKLAYIASEASSPSRLARWPGGGERLAAAAFSRLGAPRRRITRPHRTQYHLWFATRHCTSALLLRHLITVI